MRGDGPKVRFLAGKRVHLNRTRVGGAIITIVNETEFEETEARAADILQFPTQPPALPEKITTREQLDLDWPEGTRIGTGSASYDLVYTRVDGEWRHDEMWRPWGTTWCNCGGTKPSEYVGERMYGLIVLNLGADRG